jgi:ABC-type molybdate transport system substrate-binding protein
MGWSEEKTKQENLSIAEAASTMVAYTSVNKMFSSKHKGIINQTARVEAEHPPYLHELY